MRRFAHLDYQEFRPNRLHQRVGMEGCFLIRVNYFARSLALYDAVGMNGFDADEALEVLDVEGHDPGDAVDLHDRRPARVMNLDAADAGGRHELFPGRV